MSAPQLLAPLGLLAGIALLAIFVIHMRHRLPPAVHVPSIRFWTEATRDQADRRRLRLPPLTLPLVLQLAAAALITLALARPLLPPIAGLAGRSTDPEQVIVLLDGSTSMQALVNQDEDETRWDRARERTLEVLDDWRSGDVVTVVLMGSRLETMSVSTGIEVDRLRASLGDRSAPGGRADLDAALTLTEDLLLPDRKNRVLVVSDAALSVDPALAANVGAPVEVADVSDGADASNVAITNLRSRSVAGAADQSLIAFSIARFGGAPLDVPYSVQADGIDIVGGTARFDPEQVRTFEVTIPPGARSVTVSVEASDVLPSDNVAMLELSRDDLGATRILLVSDTPGPLAKALAVIPGASVDTFERSTPGIRELATGYDLVVFENAVPLPEDIPGRPMIFVNPPPLAGAFTLGGVMPAPTVSEVAVGDAMLAGVDFSGVTFGQTSIYTLGPGSVALVHGQDATAGDGPLVWRGVVGDKPYVGFGFDIATSNIGERVAFPILVARTVSSLTRSNLPASIALGDSFVFTPDPGTASITFTNPLGQQSTLPVSSGTGAGVTDVTYGSTGVSGRYTVSQVDARGQAASEGSFFVNSGHPQESRLAANPALASSLESAAGDDNPGSADGRRAELWPLLVLAVLMLVAAEWFAGQRAGPSSARNRVTVDRAGEPAR